MNNLNKKILAWTLVFWLTFSSTFASWLSYSWNLQSDLSNLINKELNSALSWANNVLNNTWITNAVSWALNNALSWTLNNTWLTNLEDSLKDVIWSWALDNLFSDYEKDLKGKKDSKKLDKLYKEKKNIKNKQISQELKDDVLNNSLSKIKRKKLRDSISQDMQNNPQILNTLVKSMKNSQKESYRFLIKTDLSIDELKNTINFFDKAEIKYLNDDWTKKVYEVLLPFSGKISRIIWNAIETWEVPENLLPNIEIISPYAVKLNADSVYLSGELLPNMWWITKMWAQNYQKWLKSKSKVKIWIIDTWIDYNNPELSWNIFVNSSEISWNWVDDDKNWYIDDVKWYNFIANSPNSLDDHGHGTHVAWIAWAIVNWKWVFWVNSNASLIPLKVLDASWYGSSYAIVDAINYAANNQIKVLNLSLGWNGNPLNDIMCNAITNAKAKWVITIVAAWNENADVSAKVPAWCKDAITVWAVDNTLTKASFSNYWAEVDVSAPWVNIYSTVLNNSYASWNGTSMATPFVSWLVWAMLAVNPTLTYDSIKQNLLTNSDNVNSWVNIWRFANMTKVMNSLWFAEDSTGTTTPTTPPPTSSWSTSSWTTSSGTINKAPTLSLTLTTLSTNKYSVTANATDSDWKVVKYEFFKDNVFVWSGTSYTTDVTKDTTILVKVTDDKWAITQASTVLKYTQPTTNSLPVITYTSWIYSSTTNYVLINAKDSDWKVTKEEIYINWVLRYVYSFNANATNIYLYYTKWSIFTLKTVVTDDKWAKSEKSISIK